MHNLINHITGAPEEAQTLETIQVAIDELQSALSEAFELRDKLKEKPNG